MPAHVIATASARTAFADSLVILPGLMCDAVMFADQLAEFPDACVIGGFYGHQRSLAGMADYALERAPGRFALLGHSMGARVALEIFRKSPERVARIALIDTGVHPTAPGEQERRYALRDRGRREGIAALVDEWLPPMLGRRAQRDQGLVERLREMCIRAGMERFEGQIEALLHRPSAESLLSAIACPMLVAVGQEDLWSPPEQHRQIVAANSGAKLRVIENAGHMLPAEAPAEFNAMLKEWMSW